MTGTKTRTWVYGSTLNDSEVADLVRAKEFPDKSGAGDRVGTAGTGVDTAVLRVSRSYEVRGLPEKVTSYDSPLPVRSA